MYQGFTSNYSSHPSLTSPLKVHLRDSRRPGTCRAMTCRGRELISGSHTYFLDPTSTWNTSPDEWSAQCWGHLRDSTNMKKDTHQAHTQSFQTRRIWNDVYDGQMMFGDHVGLNFPEICLTIEEKPRTNLTQETSPDRGSNPDPLHDRRECCPWFHSYGHLQLLNILINK